MVAVTVLLPVWNADPEYLRESIASVLAQTFRDFELLIVEDLSGVDAGAVIRTFSDSRIIHHRNERRTSLGVALNLGLQMAGAPLIARMDADDVARPDRLGRQVRFLDENPDVSVAGSRFDVIDEHGAVIGRRMLPLTHDAIARRLRRYNPISHPSVVFRREDVLSVGGYTAGIAAEDYDLWCRMLLAGFRFANLEEALVMYRFHPAGLRFIDVRGSIRETVAIKQRYFGGTMTLQERVRIIAEEVLAFLPPRLVMRLFREIEYRS